MEIIRIIISNNINVEFKINFMPDQIDYVDFTKKIVLRHLPKNEFKVFLFGSRAVGNAKLKSDIDIGIWGKQALSLKIKIAIEEDIEESIVPYKVDIVDFWIVDETFKKYALQKTIPWT